MLVVTRTAVMGGDCRGRRGGAAQAAASAARAPAVAPSEARSRRGAASVAFDAGQRPCRPGRASAGQWMGRESRGRAMPRRITDCIDFPLVRAGRKSGADS